MYLLLYACACVDLTIRLARCCLLLRPGRLRVELQGGFEADRGRERWGLRRRRRPAHRGRRQHRGGAAAERTVRRQSSAFRADGLHHGMYVCNVSVSAAAGVCTVP